MTLHRPFARAAALALSATSAAPAQRVALEASTSETPTCTEMGVRRVAVMVPPGKTRDEIRDMVSQGGMFPEGTQVVLLEVGDYTPIQNEEPFRQRMNRVFMRFIDQGIKIDGTVSVLLTVDESGAVTSARPGLGHAQMDRLLRDAWMQARFAPYAVGGCRMQAWISIPVSLTSDWSLATRELQISVGPRP